MRSGQREGSLGVIKSGAQPIGRAMAEGTIRWEAGAHVIGVRGLLERRQMAAGALRRRGCKSTGGVTLRTLQGGVGPRQCKLGHGVVIEAGRQPR
jgi:hypothetical protein